MNHSATTTPSSKMKESNDQLRNVIDNDSEGYDADEDSRGSPFSPEEMAAASLPLPAETMTVRKRRRRNATALQINHIQGVRLVSASEFDSEVSDQTETTRERHPRHHHNDHRRKRRHPKDLLVPIHQITTHEPTSKRVRWSETTSPTLFEQQQQQSPSRENTVLFVEQAIAFSTTPHILIEAKPPHLVVHANAAYHTHVLPQGSVQSLDALCCKDNDLNAVVRAAFGDRPVRVLPVWVDNRVVYYLVELKQEQQQQQQQPELQNGVDEAVTAIG